MVTSAKVQILNDGPRPISINSTAYAMRKSFPAPLTVATALPKPNPPAEIAADESLEQSYFGLQWLNNTLSINLGRIAFTTGLKSRTGPPGQSEVICAPIDPADMGGYDFFIWVLASQGKLQTLVNSVIDANLAALINFINSRFIKVDLEPDAFELTSVTADELRCTYAAISKQGKRSPWMANIVLQYSGRVTIDQKPVGLDVKFKALQAMLSVTIDTTDSEKLKITVTRLQCAVDSIEGLPMGKAASYYVPAVINTTKNSEILKKLNEKLKDLIPKGLDLGKLEKYNLEPRPKPVPPKGNHRAWMSDVRIQAKALSKIRIPGTHDSTAYAPELLLSEVLYPDVQFLKDLSEGTAPPKHDLQSKPYHLGSQAYRWLMQQISLIAQTHDASKTIQKQLEDGIRFFDIRLYYDKRAKNYYTHHTLRCPSLSTILDQIKAFLSSNSKASEFAIFHFSHIAGTFEQDKKGHATNVANMVKEKIGQWLWMPAGAAPNKDFDFHTLKSTILSSITGGSSKVLFIGSSGHEFPHSILNVDENTVYSKGDGKQPGSGLYGHWLSVTPENNESVGNILLNCHNAEQRDIVCLQWLSRKSNSTARKLIAAKPNLNMIAMDWYTEAEEESPIDVIVGSNF